MKFLDCNACFGKEIVNHECVNHENFIILEEVNLANTVEELLKEMDRVEISQAVVWHQSQYNYDATAGNENLIREIAGNEDRLIPSWVILPDITDEQYKPSVFFDAMKKNGVKTLRAYPVQDRYVLDEITMGEQLQLISELKIPLYLSPRDGYDSIYHIMRQFPNLTVILSNIGWWPSARQIYPLLKAYPNFYFETGDFSQLNGIEEICAKFGSERMLFGTNFPTNSMAGSMYTLMKAPISQEERENIAHGNMERLLNEVKL